VDTPDLRVGIRATHYYHIQCRGPSFGWPQIINITAKSSNQSVILFTAFQTKGYIRPYHVISFDKYRVGIVTLNYYGNDSAGGSKGPGRPLGGVRGKEAWEAYVPTFLPHPAAGGGARAKKPAELPLW